MGHIVGIDCFKLAKGNGKSIGIYTFAERLIQHVNRKETEISWVVFGNKDNARFLNLNSITFVELPFNYKNKLVCLIWELFLVKYYIRKYSVDKILFPRGFAPVGNKDNCIVVIHDMIPFFYHKYFPKALNRIENFYIMQRLKASIKKSGIVLTISEYSKKEIVNIVPESKNKVKVIAHGYDPVKIGKLKKPSVQGNYILAITSKLPHKNAVGILKAYEAYTKKVGNPVKLQIVGIDSVEAIYPDMDVRAKKNVICNSFLDDDSFYSMFVYAKGFLFLSLIEGFGLPPLEAMQFKVPSVVSNASCLPDTVGKGAILVNPKNADEVADAVLEILTDESSCTELVENGCNNLKRFDWEKQICEYIKVIEESF